MNAASCSAHKGLEAYRQVPVVGNNLIKTTRTSHEGIFGYLRMPLGLCTAPTIIYRTLAIILSRLHWRIVLLHLDDF